MTLILQRSRVSALLQTVQASRGPTQPTIKVVLTAIHGSKYAETLTLKTLN